jgi:sec-independent protein translocase protein TatA
MGLENPIHLAIIAMVVLMVFGAKRLPEMGRSLGSGMRGFKSALTGDEEPVTLPEPINATSVDHDTTTTRAAA